jgi:hypothetical protein
VPTIVNYMISNSQHINTQIIALQESIALWNDNYVAAVNNSTFSTDFQDCACCIEWYNSDCNGCPIYQYTGKTMCDGTPYQNVRTAIKNNTSKYNDHQQRTNVINAVVDELNFFNEVLAHVAAKKNAIK